FCIWSLFPENLAGKVVIITGASSGIGEHLAYEYAKHGACLALVARRKELLVAVAEKAEELGSPKAIVIKADVSSLGDCKTIVDETIKHFGKLDCLINNAGIAIVGLFEEQKFLTDHISTMDVNFWGSVNVTHFALPHLRKSKGRIVVIGSCGGWFCTPKVSVYNASKVAQQSFFETLRIEVAPDIGITMVTPGIISTPLAERDCFLYQTSLDKMPLQSAEGCAKAIVNSARRGDEYLTEPQWMHATFLWVMLLPEVMNSVRRLLMITGYKPKFQ
ncbi:11-beta-hydroxysteroid dehydrogenase-like protein 2, partial [Tanacetum coccineum]